jgi:hypothetical protein
MIRQRERAIRAFANMTTLLALQRRRIAAPVEKQNRLLALLQPLRDGFLELRRKNQRALLFARRLPHVHHAHKGHLLVVHALGQFQQRVLALLAVVITLQRRRCRTEHHDRPLHLPAHDGDIARVITRCFLLLVSVFVLLIHDDKAQRFATGAKIADRAPITMRARPCRILCHSSWRSPALRCECSTATSVCNFPELNRALKRSTVCGVSAISGTSTMAPLPCSSACAMAWR